MDTIKFETDNGIGWLKMNRPDRMNGMTNRMLVETHDCLQEVAARTDVRVVVLTGEGRGFCPGADLKHYAAGEKDIASAPHHFRVPVLLHEMPQVTIAAINGGCAGAGLAWASACDLRIASAKARFAIGFLEVGVSGELGLGWTLTRNLGAAKARELYLMPGKFDAAAALAMGFVSAVHEPEDFDAAARALVADLAGRDRGALRDIKANLLDAGRLPLREYIDAESERHLSRFTGAAGQETMRRFAERNRSLGSK
jgi:2-(1,2-epoxy-1,2-dihydrophenyl)acetyl-CoA isomerase